MFRKHKEISLFHVRSLGKFPVVNLIFIFAYFSRLYFHNSIEAYEFIMASYLFNITTIMVGNIMGLQRKRFMDLYFVGLE